MKTRALYVAAITVTALAALLTAWIAFPTDEDLQLAPPLQAWHGDTIASATNPYAQDFSPLADAFRPQRYRSFCGPASLATVLRAYDLEDVDQSNIFRSWTSKLDVFLSGTTLAELSSLAQHAGLHSEIAYADTLTLDSFRERLKSNLQRPGDFALVNYDRRVLNQEGAGHISPVGAYDEGRDAFLILDEAAYKYPFTWVPASLAL